MKDGAIEKVSIKKKPVKKRKIKKAVKTQPRIYEFLQGVNGLFSSKRLISYAFALAAITYAFYKNDYIIVGIFTTAATGSGFANILEKKQ